MSQIKQKRVLLVDDDEHYIRFLKEQLLARDYEIVGEAKDCEQAMKLFKSEKPDLILLDFNMLSNKGTQILQEILIQDSMAMVLMLSGKGDIATMQICLDMGAYRYIRKDYPLETIFSVIEESLNKFAGMES
jgi:DNA-binding NtrC family response regulator